MTETPTTSAFNQAIKLAGGQSSLAKRITEETGDAITQSHIWDWLNKSKRGVPAEYCRAIETITEGQITRAMLRPDVFGDDDFAVSEHPPPVAASG